jgi:mRNA deadenylase 3'-5' endonuclease subunit Ccr4
MFVEYLFEINPLTFLLMMLGLIFLVSKYFSKSDDKRKREYEETPCDYKVYNKVDEKSQKQTFSIMTYNIMAYNFTKLEWFPYCQPEYLHPRYRAPRILNEIERVNSDILCLQECDHDLFLEYYKTNLENMGYTCVYKMTSNNRVVAICTAYKKKLFKQEKASYLDLNEELSKFDDSFIKHKEAQTIQLKHYASGKSVVIVNTHLFWNPEFEYVKYGQMCSIIKHVATFYNNDLPIIFAGDINSTPGSNVIKYIYNKAPEISSSFKGDYIKNKRFIEQFWNDYKSPFELRSAYDVYKVSSTDDFADFADNHPDFTTYTHEFHDTIDYIFYTHKNIELLELLKIPTHDAEVKGLKLPSYRFASDHLKIGAKFKFK